MALGAVRVARGSCVAGRGTEMRMTSVIVSTYCKADPLGLVLLALARQSVLPDEVLIADDGSPAELRDKIAAMAAQLPFRLVHVWQADEGFRAARSRNNAIHSAKGDLLAFLDQDILPHRTWLETHCRHVTQGRAGIAYILRLTDAQSAGLNPGTIASGAFETLHDRSEMKLLDSVQRKAAFYCMLRRFGGGIKGRPAFASGNSSAWAADLRKVNGFDEEYVGWGQEDDDLGWRLYMAGILPVALANKALVSHIAHPSRPASEWRKGSNIERYRRKRTTFACAKGLSAHPHPDVRVTVLRG